MKKIRIGTRKSNLALWQAQSVASALHKVGLETELHTMDTKGDKTLDVTLAKIGSKGVFTEEIEEKLSQNQIDIAVHSAKDMPSHLPENFELIAFGKREFPNDVLLGEGKVTLDELENTTNPRVIKIGTSSTRRVALIKKYFPNAQVVPIRGNLQRRVEKLKAGVCDFLMLAKAGVVRQDFGSLIQMELPLYTFVPPAGQGSVVIETHRSLDAKLKQTIKRAFNHEESELCVRAERAFLHHFQGGCSIPIFVHAFYNDHNATSEMQIIAGIISLDGQKMVGANDFVPHDGAPSKNAVLLAKKVASLGGTQILNEIRAEQSQY